ncbi:MAG: nucleotidyltransferase family protein [Candidatus Methanofastidiosum sp.]|nr:nucleotidyltransferase family protein [Methanofastidiosum sp.]
MRNRTEIIKILNSLKTEIKNNYKAEIIGIFGSYARGEQNKYSDVDILVRFYEGATLFDLVGLSDLLEDKLKIKVDVVSERALRPELKDQILKEVVIV